MMMMPCASPEPPAAPNVTVDVTIEIYKGNDVDDDDHDDGDDDDALDYASAALPAGPNMTKAR